jgi:hypothetical protein
MCQNSMDRKELWLLVPGEGCGQSPLAVRAFSGGVKWQLVVCVCACVHVCGCDWCQQETTGICSGSHIEVLSHAFGEVND